MSIRQNNISGSIEQAAKHQRGLPLARAAALPPALRLAPHPIRAFGQPSLAAQPRHGHVPQLCRQPLFHRRCGHHAGVRVRWESAECLQFIRASAFSSDSQMRRLLTRPRQRTKANMAQHASFGRLWLGVDSRPMYSAESGPPQSADPGCDSHVCPN